MPAVLWKLAKTFPLISHTVHCPVITSYLCVVTRKRGSCLEKDTIQRALTEEEEKRRLQLSWTVNVNSWTGFGLGLLMYIENGRGQSSVAERVRSVANSNWRKLKTSCRCLQKADACFWSPLCEKIQIFRTASDDMNWSNWNKIKSIEFLLTRS